MSDNLDVRIITPEKVVFNKPIDSIIIPGTVGEMEILPGHVAIFSTIKPGQVVIREKNKKYVFASGAGIAEVCNNRVTLLVDSADGCDEIDPAASQALIAEYEDKLKNLESMDEEQRFAFETKLAAAKARIEVYERTSDDHEIAHDFSRINMSPIKPKNSDADK